MASPHEIRDAIRDSADDDDRYDAAVYVDGVLFTARRPEVSLIIRDEAKVDELTEVSRLIDEMHDQFFETTERIVSMLLGF